LQLQFSVCVFPKDPHLLFPSADTRKLFRQHLKYLLGNDMLRCSIDTLAKLDAFIAQAELGDFELAKKNYAEKLSKLQIYVPIGSLSGTPVSEKEYQRKVSLHHIALKDTTPSKADILFLNTVQSIETYGFMFYTVSDPSHKEHVLALSPDGIYFIYDTSIENALSSTNRDIFAWTNVVNCISDHTYVKLLLLTTAQGDTAQRKLKVESGHSHKNAARLKDDIDKYRDVYSTECMIRSERVQGAKTPRRAKSVSQKLSSWKRSIQRVKSVRDNKEAFRNSSELFLDGFDGTA